ncbi:S-layer homology domain-containing protein [Paenibacillus sp. FA6]|uniref:S-layer homology domain-containing protein n=1 Tax=Paenibacillus sp. FA6 TaxID=3413029 RepID=UPI003F660AD5
MSNLKLILDSLICGHYERGRNMQSKRSNSKSSKKVVSAVLASMVALSSGAAVFAEETTPVATNAVISASGSFSDVKSGFWAEKHIYKLASQGILLGDKGLFRPNDSVTQQEAVTMAIRFMNIQDQLNTNTAVVFPTNFTVNNYFKPYVALAFQHNLLDKKVETDDTTSKTTWGEKKASREWITELLVRAIGKENEANALATKATSFVDNSKISASKLGYVNAAIEMGLTNGIEGNRFDPLGSVTRAQLATFFSRGEDQTDIKYVNSSEGIVTELTDNSISLFVNGSIRSFPLNNTTAYYTKTSETKVSFSDIKLYSKVMIIENSGKAVYVEVIDPQEQLESIETTFERLFQGNSLGVSNNTAFESYNYDASTVFLDVSGNKIEPKDLTAGSQIIIKRETFTSAKNLVVVQVKTGVINKNGSGTVESIDINSKTVGIKNTVGTIESYKWDDVPVISYQDQLLVPAELKVGSVINYTVQNNTIRSIEITQAVERTIRGTIYEIGANGTTITYTKTGGSLEVKLLSAKPEIVISGIDKPILADLLADATAGDQVEMTLDSKELVTKIVVLNRQMEQKPNATVVSYDTKTKLLTILDEKNKPFVVTIDDKTKLIYNTSIPSLTGIESLLTSARKINLSYITNRALTLEVVYKYDGTVTAVDTLARKITIQGANGQSMTLPYLNTSVEMYGKSYLNISDVKVGNEVTLVLGDNQDTVSKIQMKSSVQYEVASVDSGNKWITAKSGSGTNYVYLDKATVTSDSGQSMKASDLQIGQIVNVTYSGETAISAQVTKLISGEVLAVDTAASNITVKSFAGGTDVVKATGAIKILRAGSTSTVLNSLIPGERVEIRKDVDGTTIINVLSKIEKTFWKYTDTSREFYVKKQLANDKNLYKLSPNAYIHQGDTTLSVQSLRENDKIVLYFHNDVIVEIQKQ